MAAALAAVPLIVILASMVLRLSPAEFTRAWPWSGLGTPPTLPALWAVLALFVLVSVTVVRDRTMVLPWARLGAYLGLVFGYLWFVVPAEKWTRWPLVGGAALLGLVLVIWWRTRGERGRGQCRGSWRPDLILALSPVAVGLFLHTAINLHSVGVSLLTYPLYALVQLTVLLVVPAILMADLPLTRNQMVCGCAAIFSLAHWPNGVVMLGTFVGMVIWARAYLRGRTLWRTALVMGLAATSFTQFLPDPWTANMKVGPGLVRRRVLDDMGGRVPDLRPPTEQHDTEPIAFLREIYPAILGRELDEEEAVLWSATLRHGYNCALAHRLTSAPRYLELVEQHRAPAPPPSGLGWYEAPPLWRERLERFGSVEFWDEQGGTGRGFYYALYAETFLRPFPEGRRFFYSGNLTANQRRRLVEVLHEHRRQWSLHPFTGISDADLRWSYA